MEKNTYACPSASRNPPLTNGLTEDGRKKGEQHLGGLRNFGGSYLQILFGSRIDESRRHQLKHQVVEVPSEYQPNLLEYYAYCSLSIVVDDRCFRRRSTAEIASSDK